MRVVNLMSLALLVAVLGACGGEKDPPGSERFGPYRLVPPGTGLSQRGESVLAQDENFNQTTEAEAIAGSPLYLAPLPGFDERSLLAARIGEQVVAVSHEWTGPDGTLIVSTTVVSEESLPIDIVREDEGGPLAVGGEIIGGREAIVSRPRADVSQSLGAVRVWLGGWEVTLVSTELGIDELRALAEAIALASVPLPE